MRSSTLVHLCRARDLLRERHSEAISIQAAAHEARMSTYHFIRQFKATFGQTPNAFLIDVRLEQAKRLLMTDHYSVTEVCLEVGYSSLGSFSDRFTRSIGVSPSAYRQQMRSLIQVPGIFPAQFIPYCFARMYA